MDIKICRTTEWSEKEWNSFVSGFDVTFKKHIAKQYFVDKYCSGSDGFSYHALLLNENLEVVGNISIIPCYYKRNGDVTLKIGLAVDVFIIEAYRSDPLMLRRMYKKLKDYVREQGIIAVMAVPNATAYPYWKNVVKWQDVGRIAYWGLPVNIGTILHKWKWSNMYSRIYACMMRGLAAICSRICISRQPLFKYEIMDDSSFLSERFCDSGYCWVKRSRTINCFRIVDEDGVKTAYLIYSRQGDRMTFKSLYDGVSAILKQHKVDLILFIGPIKFFQTLLLHIPQRLEPKALPLTCDLVVSETCYNDMLDPKNWDFGLLNYDVR